MEEKISINKLIAYAKSKGIIYHTNTSTKHYALIPSEQFSNKKFVIFELERGLFVFYDSYVPSAYSSTTFCGVFKQLSECESEIKILKRSWLDNLSFSKRIKTGDRYIDKSVIISSGNNGVDKFAYNTLAIKKYIELTDKIMPLEIVTIRNYDSIIPELHGKHWLALKTNKWILDDEQLYYFIKKGSQLLEV